MNANNIKIKTIVFILFIACFLFGCDKKQARGTPDAAYNDKDLEKYERLAGKLDALVQSSNGGVIEIPGTVQAYDIIDRRIYITCAKESKAVLFTTWIGKGSNLRGYLLIRGKLSEFSPTIIGNETRIELLVFAPTVTGTGKAIVTLSKTSMDNWFTVSSDWD